MMTVKGRWKLTTLLVLSLCVGLVGQAAAEEGLDHELEQFWSADREVNVVEHRLYERDGRFGAGLYTGLLSSDPFFYYFPVGLRATYHFSNSLGVEIGGAFMNAGFLTHDTELTGWLRETRRDAFNAQTDTMDRYLWRANAVAVWSPLYGKLAILQRKLAHFDLNIAAGLGAVQVERPTVDRVDFDQVVTPEVVLGTGAHFYLTESFLVRVDGRGYVFLGAEAPHNEGSFFGRLKFPIEFLVGATYLF